jgi:4,5:9,10-diseco-3-hydroxy-5,9,17-trioxoandrosta-1(10),2-diene-4-oate hydrolase
VSRADDAAPAGERFGEGHVEVDGVRLRYVEAGHGAPLVYLHGEHGLQLTTAHALLSQHHRVVVFELPAPAAPPASPRAAGVSPAAVTSAPALAAALARAIGSLGLDGVNLLGSSSGATTALWLALQAPGRVRALVLESPPALGDPELERQLPHLAIPTLVLLGTRDPGSAPGTGSRYKELLPASQLVFVYDGGRAIGADRPEAFADVVRDFVERGEAFVISQAETLRHP